jgi:predicted acyltransferase
LRGFDMFWLLGGQQIVAALAKGAPAGSWLHAVREQFTHVEWAGFRFYDFIFPLFLFLIGMAVPYAVDRRRARGDSHAAILRHALLRFSGMVFFGWWVTGNLLSWEFAQMRLSYSVLMMLGFGYLIAVVLALYASLQMQIIATGVILVGYWALQMGVPPPGQLAGDFKPGAILSDWLYDHSVGLLGKPWSSPYGRGFLLSLWPHGATAMLGVFATQILRRVREPGKKLRSLILLGGACLAAGWLWSFHFPIVKNRWTSTYVLWAGGWSFLLLALFYWIIDVRGLRRWAGLFTAIGSNSLLAYLIAGVFVAPFRSLAERLFGGLLAHLGPYWVGVGMAFATFGFAWLLLIHLHRNRIFLRL